MKVSNNFYVTYWLKNTLMASGTGAVLGFFSSYIVIIYDPSWNLLIGALLAVIIFQFTVYKKFWGKRRGEFEYEFKVKMIDKKVKNFVSLYLGRSEYLRYVSDGMNSISTIQRDLCKRLLYNDRVKLNNDFLYYIHMKLSFLFKKDDNLEKEISALKYALEIIPDDMIANHRLAICSELRDSGEDAIKYYQNALKDRSIDSKELKDFISDQIERVKSKGTMNKPPALGLRYMTW